MTLPASGPGRLLERTGDGAPRGMTVHDRTRLIGRLRHLPPLIDESLRSRGRDRTACPSRPDPPGTIALLPPGEGNGMRAGLPRKAAGFLRGVRFSSATGPAACACSLDSACRSRNCLHVQRATLRAQQARPQLLPRTSPYRPAGRVDTATRRGAGRLAADHEPGRRMPSPPPARKSAAPSHIGPARPAAGCAPGPAIRSDGPDAAPQHVDSVKPM